MTPLKNKGYIYKVTNIITGQFYIGQRSSYTGSPEDDLGVNYFTSSGHVRPLFKNNTSEWQKEILYRDIQYAETLDDMEGYAIHKEIKDSRCMNRYDPTTRVGFSTAGTHLSEETRAKLSTSHRYLSEETRAKLREAAKHRSEEWRAKLSASHRGKHPSEEAKAKMSAARKGKHRSEETRARMSASHRGKHFSDETRAKQSAAHKVKHPSAAVRARMSAAHRARFKC